MGDKEKGQGRTKENGNRTLGAENNASSISFVLLGVGENLWFQAKDVVASGRRVFNLSSNHKEVRSV